jgi:ATP-dependent DNA helicase RecQ
VQAAVEFLRGDTLVLEPRDRWPGPVLPEIERLLPAALERHESGRAKTVIPERLRARAGRVLCVYGDAGWGREVARGKYETGRFTDDLVTAASNLIQQKWNPDPAPEWVTSVPSLRHSELAQDFAQRLATKLGLPYLPALRKRRETPSQKEMQNSAMQLRNVLEAFEVVAVKLPDPERPITEAGGWPDKLHGLLHQLTAKIGLTAGLPSAPVLLVDDVVDSGWTLTLLAVLLQQHGSGPVYPFALAKASPRGS